MLDERDIRKWQRVETHGCGVEHKDLLACKRKRWSRFA